jgi:hypothetical protein
MKFAEGAQVIAEQKSYKLITLKRHLTYSCVLKSRKNSKKWNTFLCPASCIVANDNIFIENI